jgi:hypothetical protein
MFARNMMFLRIAIISVGLVCRFSLILKDAAAFPLYCQQITQLMRGGSKNETFPEGERYIYRRVVFHHLTKIQPLRQA